MKYIITTLAIIIMCFSTIAQQSINVSNIEIVRDEYGIPHIFTKTDVEAVYGVGWAQCEDNFNLMQDNFGSCKGYSGRLMGKTGALLDYLYQAFKVEEFVEERYNKDISPEIENMLKSYCLAINNYAKTHPKEVKTKKTFPIRPKDVLGNHVLHMLLGHSSLMDLAKLLSKDYSYEISNQARKGSNAIAFSPEITSDQKTYLIGNPHQPVNGIGNFWEVSVHSEEGYEMYGVTFSVGGLIPAMGTNKNLGWTHTVNYQNSSDVYELEMHASKKNHYKYDDEWLELEEEKITLKVKVAGVVIPVKKKCYWSKYGPTFKKESKMYSFKSSVFYNIKTMETWYRMGLAKNYDEFIDAVGNQGLTGYTITYGDRGGNIYHLSNYIHPYRDENFDWRNVLSGNTSKNNWNLEKCHPVSDLPQVKNPDCGYVYNCNNTVFKMTGKGENPRPEEFPRSFHLLETNTTRANNLGKALSEIEKINFEEARLMRESVKIDKNKLSFRNFMNGDSISQILAAHPELSDYKGVFDKWDGSYDMHNKQASIVALSNLYIIEYIKSKFGNVEKDVPEEEIVKAIKKATKFLKRHHGTLEIELGEVQKAVRDKHEYPMYGGPNSLANASFKPYKKGKLELVAGDSYIFYAKYSKEGLEVLQTINAFGNSNKKGHPHSLDQTDLYINKKTKTVELNLNKLKQSGTVYHPE